MMTKVGESHDTVKGVPVKLIKELQNNARMRGAGRLYFYLRHHIGSKYHPKTERPILRQHFSNYQLDRYFKALLTAGFLRRDKAGNFYITSFRTLCPRGVKPDGSRRRQAVTDLPADVLLEDRAWKDYIAGVAILTYVRALRSGKTRKLAPRYAATNNPTGLLLGPQGLFNPPLSYANSSVTGCALSILSKHFARHRSTMSRWRRRGQVAGYNLLRHFTPFTINVDGAWRQLTTSFRERQVLRDEGWRPDRINPNRIVGIGSLTLIEEPAQICCIKNIFRMK